MTYDEAIAMGGQDITTPETDYERAIRMGGQDITQMVDLSQYSDEDLMKIANQSNQGNKDLSQYSDDQLKAIANQQQPTQKSTQQTPQQNQLPDWMLNYPNLAGLYGAAKAVVQPIIEAGGLIGGGLVGGAAGLGGTPAGAVLGAVAGAGLGYAGAKEVNKAIETLAGEKAPQTISQGLAEATRNVGAGAEMQMSGDIAGQVLPFIGQLAKKAYTGVAGLTTTQGSKAFEAALEGSPAFKEAMRTGDQQAILQNARDAFEQLKLNRRIDYQNNLDNLMQQTGVQIEKQPLMDKINNVVEKFGIAKNDSGKYIFGKDSNIDYQSRAPLRRLLNAIDQFGGTETQLTPELQMLKDMPTSLKRNPEYQKLINSANNNPNLTPKQADNLKQLIDDFYSPNKNANAKVLIPL